MTFQEMYILKNGIQYISLISRTIILISRNHFLLLICNFEIFVGLETHSIRLCSNGRDQFHRAEWINRLPSRICLHFTQPTARIIGQLSVSVVKPQQSSPQLSIHSQCGVEKINVFRFFPPTSLFAHYYRCSHNILVVRWSQWSA